MSNVTFAQVSDARGIRSVERLAREIWIEHYTPIIGRAQVDYMLDRFQSAEAIARQIGDEGYLYYLIDAGTRHVGYLAVVPRPSGFELFLSKIYVRSAERGRGYGRAAVAFAENNARALGMRKITLAVNRLNAGAIEAYVRMGFRKAGTAVTDIGGGFFMDDNLMEKRIVCEKDLTGAK